MKTEEEILQLLKDIENYHVERTISTNDMAKFCEAICAFSNDMPNSGECGYLIIGAKDDGTLSGLKVTDKLYKTITAIRSDGNILPYPSMSVFKYSFPKGDLLVVEVVPYKFPPVKFRDRTWIRIGPRKDTATEAEERALRERRKANLLSFETFPCLGATLDDLDVNLFQTKYLPAVVDDDMLATEQRDVKHQMTALRFYNLEEDCPTYAAIILFGRKPEYYLPGAYIQYVYFDGLDNSAEIVNEHKFSGSLVKILESLDTFIQSSIIEKTPKPISALREKLVYNYPVWAIRELLMNAVMHRDYQSNTPIKFYQYKDRIEIDNAGGLYGNAKPENFPNVNDYRNPIIAEAMKALGYVNRYNRGIARVQKDLNDNGNGSAVFSVGNITVFNVNVSDAIFLFNKEKIELANMDRDLVNEVLYRPFESSNILLQKELDCNYLSLLNTIDKVLLGQLSEKRTYDILHALISGALNRKVLLEDVLHMSNQYYSYNRYIQPLLDLRLLTLTVNDKPRSPKQRYRLTNLGYCLLKSYWEKEQKEGL